MNEKQNNKDYLMFKIINNLQIEFQSIEEALTLLEKEIAEISNDTGIGKIVASLDAPGTSVNPRGDKLKKVIYDSTEDIAEEAYYREHKTGDGGVVKIYIYPKSSTGFLVDKEVLTYLSIIILRVLGRTRMSLILQDSQFTDLMTGLYNADGFIRRGTILLKQGNIEKYTAYYFNLKNFKSVNDMIGYIRGNQVIIAYAKKVKSFLNDDEVLGRLGGDNFVALIKKERAHEFDKLIQKVVIKMEFENASRVFIFCVRCGAYNIENVKEFGQVMQAISVGVQLAREGQYGNFVYLNKELFMNTIKEKGFLMQFPSIIANHEISVFYQPKMNINTGEMVGAEALARWIVDGKIKQPAEFIPTLEKDGSICKVDFYILNNVCSQIKKWLDEGKRVPVISVNFSRWHLRNENFVDEIIEIIEKNQIDPSYIEIEVTETSNVDDLKLLSETIYDMKKRGLKVAMDDFGKGYSSLTMLKSVPIDVVKIDKSFLFTNSDDNEEINKKMLKHIVSMTKDLSMEIVVEGVETEVQKDFLQSIGCNMVQGFLYAKPMPLDDFEKMM